MVFRQIVSKGFTVIEMLIVISLVAIALALAIPSMAGLVRFNRVQGEIAQLGEAIRFARSQALRQGNTVILCSSLKGQSCDAGNSWNMGWMVFTDENRNGTPDQEEVIRVEQGFGGNDLLNASDNISQLKFNRDGFIFDLPASGKMIFTLTTTPVDAAAQRCLSINLTGHYSIHKVGHADCT